MAASGVSRSELQTSFVVCWLKITPPCSGRCNVFFEYKKQLLYHGIFQHRCSHYKTIPPNLSIFSPPVAITLTDGQQEDFGPYTTRMDGDGSLYDEILKAGALCMEHAPVDRPGRDTSNDLTVFPPSDNLCALVMGVLCEAKAPERSGPIGLRANSEEPS